MLDYSKYRNQKKFGSPMSAERKVYRKESDRLHESFKQDALYATDLTFHPKANDIFNYAWEQGHSSGNEEVYGYLIELACLFEPIGESSPVSELEKAKEINAVMLKALEGIASQAYRGHAQPLIGMAKVAIHEARGDDND